MITTKEPKRPWLLMLHMTANAPNLEEPLALDLKELSEALGGGSTIKPPLADPEMNVFVIVQIDGPNGVFRRYWVKKDGHVLLDHGRSQDGTFLRFVTETIRDFEADRRALVLWGHSVGIAHSVEVPNQFLAPLGAPKKKAGAATAATSFLEDVLTSFAPAGPLGGIWHDLKCLGSHALHIVGFDACFMASVEIAYELKDVTHFVLAPQAAISLKGWHYDLLLQNILHNPAVITRRAHYAREDALTLGRAVVEQVGLSRSSPETLSLLEVERAKDLEEPFKTLAERLRVLLYSPRQETQMRRLIFDVFDHAIWAGGRQFLDLADLVRLIASRIPDREARDAATRVLELLSATRAGASANVRVAHRLVVDQLSMLDVPLGGISIFCPWPRATVHETRSGVRNVEISVRLYAGLEFVRNTNWHKLFIDIDNFLATERLWVRRESADTLDYAEETAQGRVDGPKPSSRVDGPKPSSRADSPKPAGRGDDPRPYRPY